MNLDEGENIVSFELTDGVGNKTTENVAITRINPALLEAIAEAEKAVSELEALIEQANNSQEAQRVIDNAKEKVAKVKEINNGYDTSEWVEIIEAQQKIVNQMKDNETDQAELEAAITTAAEAVSGLSEAVASAGNANKAQEEINKVREKIQKVKELDENYDTSNWDSAVAE